MKLFSETDFSRIRNSTVIIDIDGTLVPDGESDLSFAVLQKVQDIKYRNDVYFCSNKKDDKRNQEISMVVGVKFLNGRKPYSNDIYKLNIQKRSVVVIGDKLLTDGIFARRLGVKFIKVKRLISGRESFFARFTYLVDDTASFFVNNLGDIFIKLLKLINNQKLFIPILLGFVIFWGFVLRIYKLGEQSLWIDEGFSILTAQGILKHGYPLLASGFVAKLDFLHTYLMAGFMALFGFDAFDPWSARLPSVFLGIGTIVLIYYIAYFIFKNRYVGILSAVLITFSYWDIAWARQARMYAYLQFFFFLTLFFMFRFLTKRRLVDVLGVVLATIGAVFSHRLGLILIPYFFIAIAITLLSLFLNRKIYNLPYPPEIKIAISYFRTWSQTRYIIGIIGILTAVLLFYFIREGWQWARSGFELKQFVSSNLQTYIWDTRKFLVIAASAGTVLSFIKIGRPLIIFFTIFAYLIPFQAIALTAWRQEFRYIFFFTPVLFIFAAYGCYALGTIFRQRFLRYSFSTVLIFLIIWQTPHVLTPRVFYGLEQGVPQPDFARAYEFIQQNREGGDLVISPLSVMDALYLKQVDYWILISLTAQDKDIEYELDEQGNKRDKYTNAMAIQGTEELKRVIANQQGYIVIDDFALNGRIPADIIKYINRNMALVWQKDDGFWRKIWVYKFDNI